MCRLRSVPSFICVTSFWSAALAGVIVLCLARAVVELSDARGLDALAVLSQLCCVTGSPVILASMRQFTHPHWCRPALSDWRQWAMNDTREVGPSTTRFSEHYKSPTACSRAARQLISSNSEIRVSLD